MADKKAKDKVNPKPEDEPKEEEEKAPSRPMPFMIKSGTTKDYWLNMMVYGDYGVGKTHFCGTAADVANMKDVLILDVEAGDLTLRKRIQSGQVDTISIGDYKTFSQVHEYLKAHCRFRDDGDVNRLRKSEARLKGVDPSEIKRPRQYRTIIIDSLTEVQKLCMYNLVGIDIGTTPLDEEPNNDNLPWYAAQEMMRFLIRTFRNLPMNCLIVCSVNMEQDKQKEYHYKPMLPGKLAHEAQGFLDVVGFLVAQDAKDEEGKEIVKRRLFLQPSQFWSAKDRYHESNSVRYIDDPSVSKFLEA